MNVISHANLLLLWTTGSTLLTAPLLQLVDGAAFTPSSSNNRVTRSHSSFSPSNSSSFRLFVKSPPGGVSVDSDEKTSSKSSSKAKSSSTTAASSTTISLPFQNRGKVNEIDFCMSPSDVSLSRLSTSSSSISMTTDDNNNDDDDDNDDSSSSSPRIISLTRALNNVSNRAVRRILLSRSWPSAEALNMSLRQVLASGGTTQDKKNDDGDGGDDTSSSGGTSSMDASSNLNDNDVSSSNSNNKNSVDDETKCPVPKPILNIIMRRSEEADESSIISPTTNNASTNSSDSSNIKGNSSSSKTKTKRRGMSDEQWVNEQMTAFREGYGALPGYEYADAYLECILSLATTGLESPRVKEVFDGAVYDDSYRRVISVLKSVGVVFEGVIDDENKDNEPRMKIATKLVDQDICWSMLDKIAIRNGKRNDGIQIMNKNPTTPILITRGKEEEEDTKLEKEKEEEEKKKEGVSNIRIEDDEKVYVKDKKGVDKLLFWLKPKKIDELNERGGDEVTIVNEEVSEDIQNNKIEKSDNKEEKQENTIIKPEDLGGVLLSSEEPTITRQLNVLSNIVKRALLFGGDQELLVLSETLEADKPAFIKRWYPDSADIILDDWKMETRPGVQYFNCLVQLLKECYNNGVLNSLDPPLPLAPSYANSYERLTALLIELGSGYVKAVSTEKILQSIPKTATEEFIRFSNWEVSLRQIKPDVSDYPVDLVGTWQVKDEIGGKIIGTSTVVFNPDGEVSVDPPARGLRWRLDPGPTHLDTCTFQVLSEDGAILQYKGFMDRGARLESRFSKRSIKIRGAVTFQMRDGDTTSMGEIYKRDMLPVNTQTGTTRFVMSKVFDLDEK